MAYEGMVTLVLTHPTARPASWRRRRSLGPGRPADLNRPTRCESQVPSLKSQVTRETLLKDAQARRDCGAGGRVEENLDDESC